MSETPFTQYYEQQIIIRDDGVYVGDEKIPGVLATKFTVRQEAGLPPHFEVTFTLQSGVKPKFELDKCEVRVRKPLGVEHVVRYRTERADSGGDPQ